MKNKSLITVILSLFLVVGIGFVYAGTQSQKEDPIVESIVKECARMESMSCDFRQVRTVPLMDAPQESRGRMLYRRPDALKWSYTEPFVNSFTIDGDMITINNGDGDTYGMISGNNNSYVVANGYSGGAYGEYKIKSEWWR